MGNKRFNRIKKPLAILLVFCFVLSITAASASAVSNGYDNGYKKGYNDGKKQSDKNCKQFGSRPNLSKVPSPSLKSSWIQSYKNSYSSGYKKGYIDGYNGNRYLCLK